MYCTFQFTVTWSRISPLLVEANCQPYCLLLLNLKIVTLTLPITEKVSNYCNTLDVTGYLFISFKYQATFDADWLLKNEHQKGGNIPIRHISCFQMKRTRKNLTWQSRSLFLVTLRITSNHLKLRELWLLDLLVSHCISVTKTLISSSNESLWLQFCVFHFLSL